MADVVLDVYGTSSAWNSLQQSATVDAVEMEASNEIIGNDMPEAEVEVKMEPIVETLEENSNDHHFVGIANARIPSTADIGAANLWNSKATSCLITQYKKYRQMVGQSTQLRSLREMFEMISLEMQKYGYYFSAQKCENKWRVLERKYMNLAFREKLKKPGRMRHYGHWEHKRALDEIFSEKKQRMYLNEEDYPPPSGSRNLVAKMDEERAAQSAASNSFRIVNASTLTSLNNGANENGVAPSLGDKIEKLIDVLKQNYAMAEAARERRHKEEMSLRHSELEVQRRLLQLKEQKMELQREKIYAAMNHFQTKIL